MGKLLTLTAASAPLLGSDLYEITAKIISDQDLANDTKPIKIY